MSYCTLCGCRWINGYMGCSRPNCNEYRMVTECNEWPVSLGLSIRRFVRACEVHQLREDICMGAYSIAMQNYAHGAKEPPPRDDSELFRTALARLAAMAMEGE